MVAQRARIRALTEGGRGEPLGAIVSGVGVEGQPRTCPERHGGPGPVARCVSPSEGRPEARLPRPRASGVRAEGGKSDVERERRTDGRVESKESEALFEGDDEMKRAISPASPASPASPVSLY